MDKILLVLLPFWDPQFPPSGISCLKSFLQKHDFNVKTVDANVEKKLNEIYYRYFDSLKECVLEERRGNFYKVGFDVLRHHMMAFLHRKDETEYIGLIKLTIYNTFYVDTDNAHILTLDKIISEFYSRLEEYFIGLLEREKPGVLGISVYSGTLPASVFAFRLCRERYPQIKTVMGGGVFADILAPGSPNLDKFKEKTPYIDKIIIGEGEILLLKLLQGKLDESKRVYTLQDINNEILDISSSEIPDPSDFDIKYYPTLFSYTSRSCPFQCRFCSETVHWGTYRKKNAKKVVEEFVQLHKRYRSQLFLLGDSLLNPTVDDVAKELSKLSLSIYWDGYLRIDRHVCDTQNTMLWRRGGFYRARLGVESGSQHVLDLMHKEITVKQTKAAISSLAFAGIKTTTYWVVGYPGEREDDFQQTLDLLEEIGDDIYEADCSPFWYFLTGQASNDFWKYKNFSLYPDNVKNMLMVQTWVLDCEPNREEIHRRMWRFVEHCRKLGIPNPYSLSDIHKADERWKELHKNAVPALVEFKEPDNYINENKSLKKLHNAVDFEDDGDFDF